MPLTLRRIGSSRAVRLLRCAGTACLIVGTDIAAQAPTAPTQSAVTTLHLLRSEGHVGQAVKVMRAVDGTGSLAAADSIADSLAAFAIANAGRDEWVRQVQAAVSALGEAGSARGPGRPYAGAVERLMRVVEESSVPMAGALYYVTLAANRASAVSRLGRLATTENPTAHRAIEFLDERMGPEGVAALRCLSAEPHLLRSPAVRRLLGEVARRRGWRSTDDCRA